MTPAFKDFLGQIVDAHLERESARRELARLEAAATEAREALQDKEKAVLILTGKINQHATEAGIEPIGTSRGSQRVLLHGEFVIFQTVGDYAQVTTRISKISN